MKDKSKIKSLLTIPLVTTALLTSCQTNNLTVIKHPSYTNTVETKQGLLRGTYNKDRDVEIFAGIPYAKPPVGDLRWKEPQDPQPWEGIKDATSFAPIAMQTRSTPLIAWLYNVIGRHDPNGDREEKAPMSEDCLYLNIWKPNTEETDLPVLVYIHGGSLMSGSSIFEGYDGESMAKHGIIQVNIAYRVGIMGYFADSQLADESPNGTTGNYGLLDQIKALQWVHDNIAAFGGNPENITIAGESAGSSSVSALCTSPLAKGLFKRAIGESSSVVVKVPPHTFRSMDSALKMGQAIKTEFNVTSVEELRKIPADKLIKTQYRNSAMTVDGYALTEYPWDTYQKGNNNEEALLSGYNKDEAYAFTLLLKVNKNNYRDRIEAVMGQYTDEVISLYPATNNKNAKTQYDNVFTARTFAYPHHTWNNAAYANGEKVWQYYFTKTNKGIKAYHSGEIPYAYGNLDKTPNCFNKSDYALQDIMQGYWINFIKTGNPNGDNLPVWENYNPEEGNVLELGNKVYMRQDPYLELYKILDKEQSTLVR